MTRREFTVLIVVGVILLLAIGGGGAFFIYMRILDGEAQVTDLQNKVKDSKQRLDRVRKDRPLLERWKSMSLPADLSEARATYKQELLDLIQANSYGGGMVLEEFPNGPPDTKSAIVHPSKPGKIPLYTGVNYLVRVRTKMPNLVTLIEDAQCKPRMHRIKTMTIEKVNDKKQPDMLTVNITFEALSILDADAGKKDSRITDVRRMAAIDIAAAMRKVPAGLGMATFYLGPTGPYIEPLNRPQSQVRSYADVNRKNVFIGWQPPAKAIVDPPPPIVSKGPEPRTEDIINMMRFNRFISMTQDIEAGRTEAWLWDASINHKERLRAIGGFNKFAMLQTPKLGKLVHGVVSKIEGNTIIFRVSLNGSEPTGSSSLDSKWWRYPIDENFYNLHNSDMSMLLMEGKAKAADKGKLYVVNAPYWDKLTAAKGKAKIEFASDKKTFRFPGDSSQGEVVHKDAKVVVLKMQSWPPKSPISPTLAVDRIYPEPNVIYKVHKNHLADLLETKKVKSGEEGRVYVMRKEYWDVLRSSNPALIKSSGFTGTGAKATAMTFDFYGGLIRGKVWETPEAAILILDEKYCHCPGNPDQKIAESWHEGFLVLRIDHMVQDALLSPLPKDRLAEFLPKR